MLPLTLSDGPSVFAGEMQGTVHRLLLETRQSELKPGSVLLLKQVWGAPDGGLLSDPPTLEKAPELSAWLPFLGGGWRGEAVL